MDLHLREFARQWLFVAALAAAPVILTAFAAIPYVLGRHPGELPRSMPAVERHPS